MISKVPGYQATFKSHLRCKNADSLICIYRRPLRGCLTKSNVNHKTFGHVGIGNHKILFCITRELIFMFTGIHETV